jgi:hypothetical protein
MFCHMKVTNATHTTNRPVRIHAVIFFQRRFLVGPGMMEEELLIIPTYCQTASPEFRNVVARVTLVNNAK